jgi:hypothetical protein
MRDKDGAADQDPIYLPGHGRNLNLARAGKRRGSYFFVKVVMTLTLPAMFSRWVIVVPLMQKS